MIQATYEDGGLALNLQQAPNVIGLQLQKWMTLVVRHLHAAVARNIGDGGLVGRRTGNLARAIMDSVQVTSGGEIIGAVWPDPTKAPYGAIQELGGAIIPTHASVLTIPLEAMLTANGVARGTAAQVRANPEAFGFKSSFIPKGHDVIMAIPLDARKGAVVPIFALRPSVTLPARHYLAQTLVEELDWIMQALEDVTGESVELIMGGAPA